MAKVKFGANDSQYFMLTDLKKAVDPAKPTFRVGDKVFKDGQPGVIEAIERNGYKVRYGPGKYAFKYERAEDLMSPQQAAAEQERQRQEQTQKPLRAQFMDEAAAFMQTIYKLAPFYDSKYNQIGTGITQENKTYEEWRRDLESLDIVCRKYSNMTNPAMDSIYQSDVKYFPADWCKIASQRTEILQKTKRAVGDTFAKADIKSLMIGIERALNDEEGYVSSEIQTLLYDRAAWEQSILPAMRKYYLDANAVVPPEILKPLEEKTAELRAKIEREAPTRGWTQPSYADAALEAVIRRQSLTDFPGIKILKIGMDFTTWVARDDKSYVGSDSKFKYYRITPGAYRFKRGLALVKLPNQPFCQVKNFQLTQYKAGAGYGAAKPTISGGGTFVKCP